MIKITIRAESMNDRRAPPLPSRWPCVEIYPYESWNDPGLHTSIISSLLPLVNSKKEAKEADKTTDNSNTVSRVELIP